MGKRPLFCITRTATAIRFDSSSGSSFTDTILENEYASVLRAAFVVAPQQQTEIPAQGGKQRTANTEEK